MTATLIPGTPIPGTPNLASANPANPISPAATGRVPRDTRIDLLRGLALATIYINHVPGTVFEHWTSRNFGFSDAAEAFVLISGLSAALAYGRYFAGGSGWQGLWRCWGRAWTLYLVQITISVMVLGMVAAILRFAAFPDMMMADNFRMLVTDPVGVFIGLPILGHQFGYINILPVYIVLLLAAPLILWVGRRWPLGLLAASVGLWLLAGMTRINFPNYPGGGGWFLNPLSWQLIFVVGALTGLALSQGRRFVPARPALIAIAAGYLLLSLLWMRIDAVREIGNIGLVWLADIGAPRVITNFNKTFLETPRLLHVLALAYVLSVLPGLTRLSQSRWMSPLTVMGRLALPVFAVGTVLSFAAKAVLRINDPAGPLLDAAVIWGGLAVLVLFAFAREAALRTIRGGKGAPG